MHRAVLILAVWALCSSSLQAQIVTRKTYLEYARKSADWAWQHYDDIVTTWKSQVQQRAAAEYNPPDYLLEMACIYAQLYAQEGRSEYAERARKVLLAYGDFRSYYPEAMRNKRVEYKQGLPALANFFTSMRYTRAYDILRRRGIFSQKEQTVINRLIGESTDNILVSQEWGAMNRAMIRGECLAWAVRAVPEHPRAELWRMYLKALVDDNWGVWQIEDATHYHGIWLYSLISCAEALNKIPELFKTPEMYYNAQYYLHLLSPDAMIPDFGDAHWRGNWQLFLAFFEAAAKAYQSPELKWAAQRILQAFVDWKNPTSGLGYTFMDCYLWADDAVKPCTPKELSEEVMEDVQGKKMVFRNGWGADATYLLLNYRDEGDGGLLFRDYLRDTIPVEEEKMTHGHADENSISLLMSGGSVLLHDGGYRDNMPSGPFGAYRQDYFHNRLCVRQEKIFMGQKAGESRYALNKTGAVPGQPVLEFFHNAGSYRRVRTQKIDFLSFSNFDYSRTRVIDDLAGYEADRIITYYRNPEIFVVFDVFKSRTEAFFTASNMWHTRKILARGDHWYDTVYDSIGSWQTQQNKRLFIIFPQTHFRLEGTEPERRYYQNEWLIHQTTAQHFELGQHIVFTTVLIPHADAETVDPWLANIKMTACEPADKGVAVSIDLPDRNLLIAAKKDLRMDMTRDYRRPKYTYETGKLRFGPLESNADYAFAEIKKDTIDYTAVNLTKFSFAGQVFFTQDSTSSGLAFDGGPDAAGVNKVRFWRERRLLNR